MSRTPSRTSLALASLGIIIAFVVLKEHWGHALGVLPYLILLACPLLHIFSHGDHGGAHRRSPRAPGRNGNPSTPPR